MMRLTTTGLSVLVVALGFSLSCGNCNVQAVINSLSPAAAKAGGDQFVLTIKGNNFLPSSKIIWNSTPLPTTFVNSGQLTAIVPASDLVAQQTVTIFVFNPAGSSTLGFGFSSDSGCGGYSNPAAFTISA